MYRIVSEHLATFLEHTEHTYNAPLPKYGVDTFENYLGCGDVAGGFLRCHCEGCQHDVLVAFSCKHRGLCPSCGTRRMCNEAVQSVDRVFPNVPIRQWVLSLPWELRALAVTKPDVLGAMDRIFAEEIARMTKRLTGIAGAETGSIGCPQLFGGSVNVHPHLHTMAADGVFEKIVAGGVRFHDAPAPSRDNLAEVAKRVRDRAVRWLRRRGYIDERAAEERSNEVAEPSPIEGYVQLALAGGAFLARPAVKPEDAKDAALDRRERSFSARCDGFDVHCAVRIAAADDDDSRRERLVRYCTRPPIALDRIEVMRDGRIAYLMKTARKGCTHRVMTPMEFMARLAALVPRPKIPRVRYHGVFASRSSWRRLVTLKAPPQTKPCVAEAAASTTAPAAAAAVSLATIKPVPASPATSKPSSAAPVPAFAFALPLAPAEPAASVGPTEPVIFVDPTMISVAHWGRLDNGALLARARYVEWAVLMIRTWGFDVLRCPRCSRKLRVVATITQPDVVTKILKHLGVRSTPLPRAPARDPDWAQTALGFEAA